MNAAGIDQIMEEASRRLAATDYLSCETLCEQALTLARKAGDFDRYSRILLPLQEARRQRRQTAFDAGVFWVTARPDPLVRLLETHSRGCLMLPSPPFTPSDLATLRTEARRRNLYVELLAVDAAALSQMAQERLELHGDALLAALPAGDDQAALEKLEALLPEIGDHEIAHQRLQALARAIARRQAIDQTAAGGGA